MSDLPTPHSPHLRPGRPSWTSGFALWLGAAIAFVALAGFASAFNRFPWDRPVTREVQESDSALILQLEEVADVLGGMPVVTAATALIGVICLAYHQRALVAAALFLVPLQALGLLLKLLVDRPRPATDVVNVRSFPSGLSFPSGHALAAALLCTLLLFAAARSTTGWKRSAISSVGLAYAAIVGLERIYDGVHWSSDVMGGYLLGALMMVATVRAFDYLLRETPSTTSGEVSRTLR